MSIAGNVILERQRWNHIELAKRLFYSRIENHIDALLLLELDFGLGRMNVYVDCCRIYLQVNEEAWIFALGQKLVVGRCHCLAEIRMVHVAVVHKEELLRHVFQRHFGLYNEALYVYDISFNAKWHKVLVEFLAENICNTLMQIFRGKLHLYIIVENHLERN